MNYENGTVRDLRIAYIGGGSRGWAWGLMTDLAKEPALSGTVSLYDIDKEAARHNEIIGNRLNGREDVKGIWNYETADTLKEALTGADFVIISILPGTFDEMESDVHAPEAYGIWQSVGDTAGPGGLVRALRTIPMFVTIAEAIRDFSPNAWVINYTNPMALCVQTLYHVFPEIKAFGCCHEVFGTQKLLASILSDVKGIPDIPRNEIITNVIGINHFTWLTSASYKAIDIFPIYRDYVEAHRTEGYAKKDDNWMNNSFACAHCVKFDLFHRYGLIAAAGDRHLAEFMPHDDYLKDPQTVKSWKFGLTTVAFRKNQLNERLARSERLLKGEEELQLKDTGEEGILLIKALLGLHTMVTNVNIPNSGQIKNLPLGSVVETNAFFSRDSIRPVDAGSIPENVLALIMPHVENHRDILKAALTCDFELALKAFRNDPLVNLNEEDSRTLLTEMIRNTKTYLPEGWQTI